ncbi:hypothetical protein QTH97_36725, partial [Variovorax sp. J22R24]|uniref:hypothetical protein n=1 Tax=Variovorax gracilis TaxID=3053502 RepID=UPI00257580E4
EVELQQRATSFDQARAALDEALASSRQAVAAMEAQMHAQQQESARLLSDSEAEVRRLRKALDETIAGKEALREKLAMELSAKQRAADEAEERHVAHERRLLHEIDRERAATRQATAELAKERKGRLAEAQTGLAALGAAEQALEKAEAAHRDAAVIWSRQHQATEVELAILRERVASAEQRAADHASHLDRQKEQSAREIVQLRESQAAMASALQQMRASRDQGVPPATRSTNAPKSRRR